MYRLFCRRIFVTLNGKEQAMANKSAGESRAEVTHMAAMRIIDAEVQQRRLKTNRLRELRLAQEARREDQAASPPPIAKRKAKS